MSEQTIKAFFAENGPLSRALGRYSQRQTQIDLALSIGDALENKKILLAEAGTGTGKTLAYLVPALLAGTKVVISTATKTLQSQIIQEDVPLLSRALEKKIPAVVLKGRQNYLCLRRFERIRSRAFLKLPSGPALDEKFQQWAGKTSTGDRAELKDLPDDYAPWSEVCSTSETCWGSQCSMQADCHFLRQRRAAQKAQIVVVNHHLFFADLAIRTASSGQVLPRYGAVVFDEAHHLESAATSFFGVQISSYRIKELARDARAMGGEGKALPKALGAALVNVETASLEFWPSLSTGETSARIKTALSGESGRRLAALLQALGHWIDRLGPMQAENKEVENLFRRSNELKEDLERFKTNPEPGEARWTETRSRAMFLHAVPIEISRKLSPLLFKSGDPIILTSATLRVGDSFDYIRSRLGIPESGKDFKAGSPFDHASQGLLYVPKAIPEPNDPKFQGEAIKEIIRLINISKGRAFCLFTSHRMLRAAAEALESAIEYPLLVQGRAPREALLGKFREEINSVLLGAQSFWEGVDVPGEALSIVIIDKIPFASPGDPMVEARIELLRSRGEQPFGKYQLPAAAMALRQGVGRLLRSTGDKGVVAILDRRVVEKNYGKFLLSAIPPFPLARDHSMVERFFFEQSIGC